MSPTPDHLLASCPYCGELTGAEPDPLPGEQAFWSDCGVCCRPILFRVTLGDTLEVERLDVLRDDDA